MRSRSVGGTGDPFWRSISDTARSNSTLLTASPLIRASTLGSWTGTGLVNAAAGGGSLAPGFDGVLAGAPGVAGAVADAPALAAGAEADCSDEGALSFEQADTNTSSRTGRARRTRQLLMKVS